MMATFLSSNPICFFSLFFLLHLSPPAGRGRKRSFRVRETLREFRCRDSPSPQPSPREERGEGAHCPRLVYPSTVRPLLITVTFLAFTLASNEITLPSFHISMVTVSPGKTGEENRAACCLKADGS